MVLFMAQAETARIETHLWAGARRLLFPLLFLLQMGCVPAYAARIHLLPDACATNGERTSHEQDSFSTTDPRTLESLVGPTQSAIEAGTIIFNVFMNPPLNLFSVNFAGNEGGQFEVDFVEAESGRKNVIVVTNNADKKPQQVLIKGDEQNIKKGAYYVVVKSGERTYVKKIVFY